MSRRRGRRGIALVGALALLTISGVVVAALVASSIAAQRSTRLGGSDAAALASAEYAASSILAGASTYQLARLPLGVTQRFAVTVEQTTELRPRRLPKTSTSATSGATTSAHLGGFDRRTSAVVPTGGRSFARRSSHPTSRFQFVRVSGRASIDRAPRFELWQLRGDIAKRLRTSFRARCTSPVSTATLGCGTCARARRERG